MITNAQNKKVVSGSNVDIEKLVNELRPFLEELNWLEKVYHIAQKFPLQQDNRSFLVPEVFTPETQQATKKKYDYFRLTPDNDFKGICFFMVDDEVVDFQPTGQNYLTYNLGIIFYVNLELIDGTKLESGLFTQDLIKDVRRKLTASVYSVSSMYSIKTITRDLYKVFQGFDMPDLKRYNRAPLQVFRFNLEVKIEEDCV